MPKVNFNNGKIFHADFDGARYHFTVGDRMSCHYDYEFLLALGATVEAGTMKPCTVEIKAGPKDPPAKDMVNHPPHYKSHASGVECIQITEHMNFCLGNTIKYLWRAGEKGSKIEDLKKARWYLDREIERLEKSHVQ